jgi:hypothetical protein
MNFLFSAAYCAGDVSTVDTVRSYRRVYVAVVRHILFSSGHKHTGHSCGNDRVGGVKRLQAL